MENTNKIENGIDFYKAYQKTSSFFITFIGIIITIASILIVFFIASLEGSKEVRASGIDCAKILSSWREDNGYGEGTFPEEKTEIFDYDGHEYYFVIESTNEDGTIEEWYFAYTAGFGYIFQDWKFYVLTAFASMVAIFSATVNHSSAIDKTTKSDEFRATLRVYGEQKAKIAKYTQYLGDYIVYKIDQIYEMEKRKKVKKAGIDYDYYCSKDFDINKLEKWQIRKLRALRKIKITDLTEGDLIEEKGYESNKVEMLPTGRGKHMRTFIINSLFSKIFAMFVSGLVVGFSVALGNWILGVTYGFGVLMSAFTATISGIDYASNTLRNRYISKTEYLKEFDNIKERFFKKEEYLPVVQTLPVENLPDCVISTSNTIGG